MDGLRCQNQTDSHCSTWARTQDMAYSVVHELKTRLTPGCVSVFNFGTCDDRLLRNARQVNDLLVKVINPVDLIREMEE